MIDRIIEIANPARLSVRDAQLVIEKPQAEQLSLPFTTPIPSSHRCGARIRDWLCRDERLQRGFGGVGHDLGIDLVAALEQTEDDGLAAGSGAAFATHTARAEVGFIAFEQPSNGELRSEISAMRRRIRRKSALTERTEMPVMPTSGSPSDPEQNNAPNAEIPWTFEDP